MGITGGCDERSLGNLQTREVFNDLSGFETDGDDLPYQTQNILRVIVPIGIVGDAAAFVGGDLILIDDPFEGGTVAEAVVVGFFRDFGEG